MSNNNNESENVLFSMHLVPGQLLSKHFLIWFTGPHEVSGSIYLQEKTEAQRG